MWVIDMNIKIIYMNCDELKKQANPQHSLEHQWAGPDRCREEFPRSIFFHKEISQPLPVIKISNLNFFIAHTKHVIYL